MDGSQVTTVVSVVGGVVGLIALTVAWSQMRIASAKTKLDLYHKRFSTYLAALEFYHYAYSDSRKDIREKANKLTQAYRESKFLFDAKDGIYDLLGEIQKGSAVVRAYEEHKQQPDSDKDVEWTLLTKSSDALLAMEKDLLALEDKLKKYISFENVRGWTFL